MEELSQVLAVLFRSTVVLFLEIEAQEAKEVAEEQLIAPAAKRLLLIQPSRVTQLTLMVAGFFRVVRVFCLSRIQSFQEIIRITSKEFKISAKTNVMNLMNLPILGLR